MKFYNENYNSIDDCPLFGTYNKKSIEEIREAAKETHKKYHCRPSWKQLEELITTLRVEELVERFGIAKGRYVKYNEENSWGYQVHETGRKNRKGRDVNVSEMPWKYMDLNAPIIQEDGFVMFQYHTAPHGSKTLDVEMSQREAATHAASGINYNIEKYLPVYKTKI